MKKAIGYIRISMKDQSNFSLAGQERYIRELAAESDMELAALFTDDGKSAKNFDRPDWHKLEAFIKEHHKIVDYLIVVKYDRFSRNAAQGLQKIELLEHKYRIMIISVFERMFIDFDSPFYFKQRADMLVAAEFELRVIRDRTKFGIHQALATGRFINHAPVGYINARDEKNKPVIILNENKADIIKTIFSMYLSGCSIREVHTTAKRSGLKMNGHSTIQRILNNCVYAGLIYAPAYRKEPAKYVKGIHEPIIEERDWWKVQQRMGTVKHKVVLNEEVPFRGLLRCHCDKYLTAGNSRSKSGRYHWYYKCNVHKKINIPAKKIHAQFDEVLEHLSLSDLHINYLGELATEEMTLQLQDREKNISWLKRELAGTIKNIDRLEEKFITGDLLPETYKKWFSKYATAESAMRYQLAELETNAEVKWKLFYEQLPRLGNIKGLYSDADLSQKRIFLRQVFKSGLSYAEGIYRTPYILPLLSHNTLILKEKGLLILEQPTQLAKENMISTPTGSIVELNFSFLQLVAEIKTA